MSQLLHIQSVVRSCWGSLLFWLPVKILDALRYFGLYKFACRMGTDPVLTALAFHRCGEVDWSKTAVRDGFVAYDFPTGEVLASAKKRYKQGSALGR